MRFLIAIALLFSVTPGMSEVAEAAVHLIGHGDLPHHDKAEHESEHTCTPLAHNCGCHAAMSAQTAARTVTTSRICEVTRMNLSAVATVFGRNGEPPPLRPPIG